MNCYVCATSREERAAVAVCPQCSVGLCLEHLRQAQQPSAGGMRFGCRHSLPPPAADPSARLPRPFRRASR
ncbi:MAG: DUF2180 family protein [Thermomicrobiales bacterium]